MIDFSRPVCVLLAAVLHFVTDCEDPWGSVAYFRDLTAPGSYLVVSHVTSDGSDPDAVNAIREAYGSASAPAVFRTGLRIGDLFDGFRLEYPGIVDVSEWRPLPGGQITEPTVRVLGGVGKKSPESR